jgi:two-component system, NtrC family, sensor kinase
MILPCLNQKRATPTDKNQAPGFQEKIYITGMKKLLLTIGWLFIIVLGTPRLYAQDSNIDSLKNLLNTSGTDTAYATLLNRISLAYLQEDAYDSAYRFADLAVKAAERMKYKHAYAMARYFSGIALRNRNDYAGSYSILQDAKRLFREMGNRAFEARTFRQIGNLFSQQGNDVEGLDNAFSALTISEKIKDSDEIMNNYLFIFGIFYSNGKYEQALDYAHRFETYAYARPSLHPRDVITQRLGYLLHDMKNDSASIRYQLESLRLSQLQKDTLGIANSYTDLGQFYSTLKNYDLARSYLTNGLSMYRIAKHDGGIGYSYFRIAKNESASGQLDSALLHHYLSIRYCSIAKDTGFMAENFESIGNIYLDKNQPKRALEYFQMALGIWSRTSDTSNVIKAYQDLETTYERLNEPGLALENHKFYSNLKDSVHSRDQAAKILEMESKRNFQQTVEQSKIQQEKDKYEAGIKIYGLLGILVFLLVAAFLLYRNSRQKQKDKVKIENAYHDLKQAQGQLVQKEKMASLGELTAGIAHEIQNPLNFVNNFSDVNLELIDEMNAEFDAGHNEKGEELSHSIKNNLEKIVYHGKRADAIVKGMLLHSQAGRGQKEEVDVNAMAEEYLRLSYHGFRAKHKSLHVKLETIFDSQLGQLECYRQDLGRTLLNLLNNAFYSVNEKMKISGDGNHENGYEPVVSVRTRKLNGQGFSSNRIEIRIRDNGTGIPQNLLHKIFQPFFTTKPTGQGTGLGLSLSYDIIKAHQGDLLVQSEEGKYTEFTIILPC